MKNKSIEKIYSRNTQYGSSLYFLKLPHNCQKIQILSSNSKFIFYVLNNSFFYTRLAFAFDLEKDFYYVHVNIGAFFLQLHFEVLHVFFSAFYFFVVGKDVDIFNEFGFGVFLCVFDNIYLSIFIYRKIIHKYQFFSYIEKNNVYIWRKNIKNILYIEFIQNIFLVYFLYVLKINFSIWVI